MSIMPGSKCSTIIIILIIIPKLSRSVNWPSTIPSKGLTEPTVHLESQLKPLASFKIIQEADRPGKFELVDVLLETQPLLHVMPFLQQDALHDYRGSSGMSTGATVAPPCMTCRQIDY
jgi:hypothetical protein